ncbi:hypothetical protein BJ508DRAFT_320515 [Ascobolus immersus RN42]|uniref:Zn(2)-C6 fungal-type domain-containing protein n=1 Tax=Ascobolus immersus RN42 TaxID=1160509 RepID=A0A3N4IMZ0_ASCIM|nr:hypothetical protein BJ508DRAFT_320515 [Ascobolus immersus RN42]
MMGGIFTHHDLSRIATTTSPISSTNGDPNSAISPHTPFDNMTQYFSPASDSGMSSKGSRARRKSSSGSEQVKHRRTRSGCFTCRTRRVKCDETHPICERCLKGSRECTYPEVTPARTSTSSRKREKMVREESSSLDELEEEDEEEEGKEGPSDPNRLHPDSGTGPRVTRRASWTSNNDRNRKIRPPIPRKGSYDPTPSPSNIMESFPGDSSVPTSPADSVQLRHRSSVTSLASAPWAHLPNDIQFFLTYYKNRITCYHYLIKLDLSQFFKTKFLDYAVQNESLMYAVVAFSAFRASVSNRTTAFQTFVEYYDKAVSSLRASLAKDPTVATLLTILQLASFEEYLGDWGNLMQHRNAAANVILTLYTPETLAQTAEGRLVYTWFSRLDLYAAMMAGRATTLSIDWSEANRAHLQMEADKNPHCLELKADLAHARLRDLAFSVADLTALKAKNRLSPQQLEEEGRKLQEGLQNWYKVLELDHTLMMSRTTVTKQPLEADNYCPFLPVDIFVGGAFTTNMLMCDYYGLMLMLAHQMPASHEGVEKILSEYAMKICGIIGGMDVYQQNAAGWLLTVEASIALASIWVPPKPEYRAWIRKQLAQIEATGYIFPEAYRTRVAELWNDPSLKTCWSESSAIGAIIQKIGDVRDIEAPKDPGKDEVREMRAVLANLRIDTSDEHSTPGAADSPESTYNTVSVGVRGNQPMFRDIDYM